MMKGAQHPRRAAVCARGGRSGKQGEHLAARCACGARRSEMQACLRSHLQAVSLLPLPCTARLVLRHHCQSPAQAAPVPAGVRARAAATASAVMLKVGSCSLPHPDKVATGGEDAFFVSSDSRAIGVAGALALPGPASHPAHPGRCRAATRPSLTERHRHRHV